MRASVIQFRVSLYVMRLNRSSELKVMTIRIAQELPLFYFDRLDILCAWIGPPFEKLWPFELLESYRCTISSKSIYYAPESDLHVKSYDHLNFSRASVVEIRASRYIMRLNRTSELKVMTIWISRELPLFIFERLDILCAWIGPPNEKLWPFEFLESFRCSISSFSICDAPKLVIRVKSYDYFEFLKRFRCSISSVSIYYAPESDLGEKSYEHSNCSRASIVQFRACRYIMRLNRTSELKVMTIWIAR